MSIDFEFVSPDDKPALLALTTLLCAESLRQPVVMFLEDFQFIDDDSKDFLPRLCRVDLLRTDQRHRMDLYALADDEFHPCQADAIVG